MHPSPDEELEIKSKNILHHETQESTGTLLKDIVQQYIITAFLTGQPNESCFPRRISQVLLGRTNKQNQEKDNYSAIITLVAYFAKGIKRQQ